MATKRATKKATASKKSKASEAPMTTDDLVELDNQGDQEEPAELAALRYNAPLYISALPESGAKGAVKTTAKPQLTAMKSAGGADWVISQGANLAVGQLGEKGVAAPSARQAKAAAGAEDSLEPHIPSWSGVTYHPKLGGPRVAPSFRRISGKRVIPDGYVFGPDDRVVYYPNSYPWRCIGKIFVWTNPNGNPAWTGSGALVGDNVVMTCSHMCPWGVSPWKMQFVPAYYDGTSVYGSGVNSYVQTYYGYQNHAQGDDMAVLKLYTPLGNTLGWFGYKTYNDDWEGGNFWTKCGYPGMVANGQRPSRVTSFPIVDDDNDGAGVELEYKADSSSGDSGGPVFGWWSGSPYVIGTHSGSEEEYQFPFSTIKNNLAAGGAALSNLIAYGRNNW